MTEEEKHEADRKTYRDALEKAMQTFYEEGYKKGYAAGVRDTKIAYEERRQTDEG